MDEDEQAMADLDEVVDKVLGNFVGDKSKGVYMYGILRLIVWIHEKDERRLRFDTQSSLQIGSSMSRCKPTIVQRRSTPNMPLLLNEAAGSAQPMQPLSAPLSGACCTTDRTVSALKSDNEVQNIRLEVISRLPGVMLWAVTLPAYEDHHMPHVSTADETAFEYGSSVGHHGPTSLAEDAGVSDLQVDDILKVIVNLEKAHASQTARVVALESRLDCTQAAERRLVELEKFQRDAGRYLNDLLRYFATYSDPAELRGRVSALSSIAGVSVRSPDYRNLYRATRMVICTQRVANIAVATTRPLWFFE